MPWCFAEEGPVEAWGGVEFFASSFPLMATIAAPAVLGSMNFQAPCSRSAALRLRKKSRGRCSMKCLRGSNPIQKIHVSRILRING
ncbi:hypothetical protein DL95DRAFT_17290 [Leptodontidium sp. 2 PMI_412]|nr:hypothetical protein DL95DRAFT_17290 [Leptodontidium sp. 2 PMI_412]